MTDDQFWTLIETHVAVDEQREADIAGLERALERLLAEDIVAFDAAFTRMLHRSYTWALWGAAYLINGGCSDDAFDYFRGWLIAQGRTVFEEALAAPDTLVDYVSGITECEEILSVAPRAYEAVAGQEMPIDVRPLPELGSGWDFDDPDEMRHRYPRLFAAFAA